MHHCSCLFAENVSTEEQKFLRGVGHWLRKRLIPLSYRKIKFRACDLWFCKHLLASTFYSTIVRRIPKVESATVMMMFSTKYTVGQMQQQDIRQNTRPATILPEINIF